jgi:transposase
LTLWISEKALSSWKSKKVGKPGGQERYSKIAIETGLAIKTSQKLAWRQTRGFICSLFKLIEVDLDVPCFTTFSKRCKKLGKIDILPEKISAGPQNIYIDSTGVRVHNGNQKKPTKKRAWRKFHIAVDDKGNIVASELSSNRATDASKVENLVNKIDRPISSAMADSAYDQKQVYEAIEKKLNSKNSKIAILPKKNAVVSDQSHPKRNSNVKSRIKVGKRDWIKKKKYNMRNRVENTFYRYKKIIGPSFSARTFQGQRVEMQMGCKILNIMTNLGMPQSSLKI